MSITRSTKSTQIGSTMIETVVALFVLAVGLLAVQAMQLNSLRSNVGTYSGTQAQILADDMINRIYAYDDITTTADNTDYDNIDTKDTVTDPNCDTAGCSATEQIQRDTFQWKNALESTLPGGRGTIASDSGAYTITVYWDNDRTGANGLNCSGDTSVDLTCFRLQQNL